MADNQPNKPGKKELTMEQRLLLAFVLMGLVLFLTPYFYKTPPPPPKKTAPATTSQTTPDGYENTACAIRAASCAANQAAAIRTCARTD